MYKMKKTKMEKGITLVALIITIIVLLILAVVAIGAVQGDGIIEYAKNARDEYGKAQENEQAIIDGYLQDLENITLLPYFGKPYNITIGSDLMSFVFYEDGSALVYSNGVVSGEKAPAGTIIYGDGTVNIGGTIGSLSSDRTQIDLGNGSILVLGELMNRTIPEGGVYTTASGTALKGDNGDEFPGAVTSGDVYEYRDYKYTYTSSEDESQSGWKVSVIDNTKTNYDVILESINGKNITDMSGTFYGCTKLSTAPAIPSTVTNMETTFMNCTALADISKVTIPSGVTSLYFTFSGSSITDLSSFVIPSTVTSLEYTFSRCTKLSNAPVIPEGVVNIQATFQGCTALPTDMSSYIIPSTVTNMTETFSGCTNLVTPPILSSSSVTTMKKTFSDCTKLATAPAIPSTVTDMNNTFNDCTSLIDVSNLVIPSGMKKMGSTFYNCTALTTGPDMSNATNITDMSYTFYYCKSLTGTLTINIEESGGSLTDCFKFTEKPITLTGSSSRYSVTWRNWLVSTANNGNVTNANNEESQS